jgi:hypothetical protein
MGVCQDDGRELLVGQEGKVVLAAQQLGNVIAISRSFNGSKAKRAIDAIEMEMLVCDEGLQRKQKDRAPSLERPP